VNRFTDESNNLKLDDFSFMPSIEIGLIKSDKKTIEGFNGEEFADVFQNLNERFPQVIPENFYKYIKFYTIISVRSPDEEDKVYR
jgi:hypothetical protein